MGEIPNNELMVKLIGIKSIMKGDDSQVVDTFGWA